MNEFLAYTVTSRFMAQAYNDGSYGASTYQGTLEEEAGTNTGTTNSTTQNLPKLPNTGMNITIGAGIGVLLIILSVLLVMRLRSHKKQRIQK